MPTTTEKAARSKATLAAELRMSVMRLRRRLAAERHPDNELSLGAMAVLGCLSRNGGELSIGALAQQERVQPPSMTRTVNCLEQDGYVTRRASDSDGRQVLVALSDLGRERLRADRLRRDAWLDHRLQELTSAERRVLREATPILARLAES